MKRLQHEHYRCAREFVLRAVPIRAPERAVSRGTRAMTKPFMPSSALALMMPVVILGGIYRGIFTPTEVSVIAVFHALGVSLFVYRGQSVRRLRRGQDFLAPDDPASLAHGRGHPRVPGTDHPCRGHRPGLAPPSGRPFERNAGHNVSAMTGLVSAAHAPRSSRVPSASGAALTVGSLCEKFCIR